jgi:hypothetical protein
MGFISRNYRQNFRPFVSLMCAFLALMCVVASLGAGRVAFAEPAYTINYQGKLTDNTGLAVPNGTYAMSFALYTQASGGGVASLDTGGLTSANLSAALTNETGTGVAVFGTGPTFTNTVTISSSTGVASTSISGLTGSALSLSGGIGASTLSLSGPSASVINLSGSFLGGGGNTINLGVAGVRLSEDGDGALTFLGLGNGSDENLTMNLDDTSNEVVFTTSTGVTKTSFNSIALNTTSASGYQISGTTYFSGDLTNDSVRIGELAGSTFTSGTTFNLAIGYEAARYASSTFGDYNQSIGVRAGYYNNSTGNNMIGYQAGYQNTGFNNNMIGYEAGYNSDGGQSNFFGLSAGYNNNGVNNNYFGTYSGYNDSGSSNNNIGYNAGYSNTGSNNNLIGYDTGRSNTGDHNNFMGYRAGYNNTGDYNEMIGYQTGRYLQSTSTVAIGAEALYGSHATAFISLNNVALGYRAGYASDDGSGNNIIIGYQAADNLTTGNNNIIIGYDIDNVTATTDNSLNIGNLIFGTGLDGTGTTLSSGNIGIGTSTPNQRLSIFKSGADSAVEFSSASGAAYKWTMGIDYSDGAKFKISSSSALGTNDRFVIDGSGNVGIGTTTPSQKLEISGNLLLSAGASRSVTSAGGELILAMTGDTYGSVNLKLQNRSGSNGAIFQNASLDLVDFGFLTSASTQHNIRFEGRDAYSKGSGNTAGEFQFGAVSGMSSPFLVTGTSTTAVLVGNFGVGDASPSQRFDVDGTNPQGLFEESTTEFLRAGVGETSNTSIIGWDDSDSLRLGVYSSPTDTTIGDLMTILSTGNVGIGTTTPAQKLQVYGDIRVGTTGSNGCIEDYGGGVIGGTCSSDERLKENIEPIATESRSYLESLTALTPVTYNWNETATSLYGKNRNVANLGLVAQDVEALFPELVSRNEDGFRQVDFRALPFYIIEAMKELWAKVQGHDERLQELEQDVQKLGSENEYLKNRISDMEDELDIDAPPPDTSSPEASPTEPTAPTYTELIGPIQTGGTQSEPSPPEEPASAANDNGSTAAEEEFLPVESVGG